MRGVRLAVLLGVLAVWLGPAGPSAVGETASDEIVVGVHASVSGAHPFPARSLSQARGLYWGWSGTEDVFGKSVRVVFADDHNDPRAARDACRGMVEQDGAFLLVGLAGVDEMQSCARWADLNGVPYIAPGATELGLGDLETFFAASMSYAQQGPMLWRLIETDPRLSAHVDKVALVWTPGPNLQDARDAFVTAMEDSSRSLVFERRMSRHPSQSELFWAAVDLALSGAQVVYVLLEPIHYARFVAQHQWFVERLPLVAQPWWVGVGIRQGLNHVLDAGCERTNGALGRGIFLSPFPGLDAVDDMAPDYTAAYQEVYGDDGDDLGLAVWGLSRVVHQMLVNAGPDATREDFVAANASATIDTGLYPTLEYQSADRFGASTAHVLRADCATRTHVTDQRFYDGS